RRREKLGGARSHKVADHRGDGGTGCLASEHEASEQRGDVKDWDERSGGIERDRGAAAEHLVVKEGPDAFLQQCPWLPHLPSSGKQASKFRRPLQFDRVAVRIANIDRG